MEAAGPQPVPGPAPGPQPAAEEIDLSLDEIIKRQRKEQADADAGAAGDSRRQRVRSRSSAPGHGRPQFRAWKQRNLQGPNRFRRGFGQQQFNRRQLRTPLPGGRRRGAAAFSGVSPLNRQVSAQEGNKKSTAFAKSRSGQQEEQAQPSAGPKRFREDAASIRAPGKSRPFLLNRGPAFQEKWVQPWWSKAPFQRGQMDSRGEGKPPRMKRWQVKPSPGAILTVSVLNPQASSLGSKRPFLPSQRALARAAKPQPKGVLLRFNFRAVANQTSLTLDERFSGLRNKRRFTAARSAGRTVTMP